MLSRLTTPEELYLDAAAVSAEDVKLLQQARPTAKSSDTQRLIFA
jgi:hypothetical protein